MERRCFHPLRVTTPTSAVIDHATTVAMSTGTDRRLSDEQLRELWLYPDTSRIFELSTKCRSDEALPVAVKTRLFLSEAGVDLSGEQQTKTKTALEYFAKGVAS